MEIQSVFDPGFARYGRVIEGYDFAPLLEKLCEISERPAGEVIYVPGDATLEALPVSVELRDGMYGGMPIQVGYCNGHNRTLNCLEYHRDSEVDVAAEDVILLLAPLQDVQNNTLDTSAVEAFLCPAGTAVQLYETTLHYAPCTADGGDGFRVVIVLPMGTNTTPPKLPPKNEEDKLLWARNKWLLAHPDSPEAGQGAFVGLTGENITL